MQSCDSPGQAAFMLAMLRQPQKRAGTPGTACCLHSAAQQGNRPLKCSQEGCLPEYILSHGLSVRSSMCNSSMLDRAGNRYRHNENRRQSWDGRVYHCPALLGPASARQLKHSQTERVDKRSAANCCSCWFPKPQAAARDCVKDSTEDLELVSLLQDISDCWSPDGWLPAPHGSKTCRTQRMQPAQAFNHAARHQQPSKKPSSSRKRSSSSMQTGHDQAQSAADIVSQRFAARPPSVITTASDSSILKAAEQAGNSMADMKRASQSMTELPDTLWEGDTPSSEAAPPPAAAASAHGHPEVAAAEPDPAHGCHEAAATAADAAHSSQEAAAAEADAAAMAAWLIQKPSLLQGVLGHLESLAASANGEISSPTLASHPPAGLIASSSAANKPYVANACDARHQFILPATAQALLCSSDSATKQKCGQLHEQVALPPPFQADVYPATACGHQPQSADSDQHQASADAEVQQSDSGSHQPNRIAGLGGSDQEGTLCANQQQCGALHLPAGFDGQGDAGECQGSCQVASCLNPVRPTGSALLEHCAAGRYDEARTLLRERAVIDTADAEGNTALMLASRGGHGRIVKLLVRKGAKLDAHNAKGKTAEQLAIHYGHNGIAVFLQDTFTGFHGQSEH